MSKSLFWLLVVLMVAGCGGDGSLTTSAKLSGDEKITLEIATGQLSPSRDLAGLGDAGHLVFRRVRPAELIIGRNQADNLVEGDEKPEVSVALGEYLIAVTELTQEQWEQLATGISVVTPWADLTDTDGITDNHVIGPSRPAVGMIRAQVETVCQHRSPPGWRLRLPTAAEWQHAALAGKDSRFAWGDIEDDVEVEKHANVWLRGKASYAHVRAVGRFQPNDLGLHDVHGNVWEMTAGLASDSTTIVCGGSWDQPVMQSRASNRMAIPSDVGLPTVGVRLVLVRE